MLTLYKVLIIFLCPLFFEYEFIQVNLDINNWFSFMNSLLFFNIKNTVRRTCYRLSLLKPLHSSEPSYVTFSPRMNTVTYTKLHVMVKKILPRIWPETCSFALLRFSRTQRDGRLRSSIITSSPQRRSVILGCNCDRNIMCYPLLRLRIHCCHYLPIASHNLTILFSSIDLSHPVAYSLRTNRSPFNRPLTSTEVGRV